MKEGRGPKGVSWFLKLHDEIQNTEFNEYLREQTRERAIYILILQLLISFVSFCAMVSKKDLKDIDEHPGSTANLSTNITLLWGPGSVLAMTVLFLSYKRLVFADLIIPV